MEGKGRGEQEVEMLEGDEGRRGCDGLGRREVLGSVGPEGQQVRGLGWGVGGLTRKMSSEQRQTTESCNI